MRARPELLWLIGPLLLSVGCNSASQAGQVDSGADGSIDGSAPYCHTGGPPAQFRSQVLPSGAITPGATSAVSVAFDNCGGETWSADRFRLVPTDVTAPWGVPFVHLTDDVPVGQRATFRFQITSPTAPGLYPYAWQLFRDDGVRLEVPSPGEQIAVLRTLDCSAPGPPARVLDEAPPPSGMAPGQAADATLSFGNCGTSTWSRNQGFQLASTDGLTTWGSSTISLSSDVPTGYAIAIAVHIVAPQRVGTYAYQWSIAQGSNQLRDPSSKHAIAVLNRVDCSSPGPPARLLAETTPPGQMAPGQTADLTLSFGNCSGQAWSAANYNLAAVDGQSTWGTSSVSLPSDVPAGFATTIPLHVVAPQTPGAYSYQWSIAQGNSLVQSPDPAESIHVGHFTPTFDWSHARFLYAFFQVQNLGAAQITQLGQLADSGMNVMMLNLPWPNNDPPSVDQINQVLATVRANPTLMRYHYMVPTGYAPDAWVQTLASIELENQDILSGYYTYDEPGEIWNGCGVSGAAQAARHDLIRAADPDATHRPVGIANTLLYWNLAGSPQSCGPSAFSTNAQDIVFIDQYNQNNMTVEDYQNQVGAFQGWKSYGFPLSRVLFILPAYLPSAAGCYGMDLVGFANNYNNAVRAVYGGGWNGLTGYGYFAFDCQVLCTSGNCSVAYGIDNCAPLFSATQTQCSQ